MNNHKCAIFLDRDGVINVNRPDNVTSWHEFEFETGSLPALVRLAETDYCLIIVSNQSGIGRGQMTRAAVDEIHAHMRRVVELAGGRIDGIYYCPHAPEQRCTCRKPSPEMLLRGKTEFDLDLAHCFFVGDWIDDVRAARNAGVTPLLVRTGRGESALLEIQRANLPLPEMFDNLSHAVEWILERQGLEPTKQEA